MAGIKTVGVGAVSLVGLLSGVAALSGFLGKPTFQSFFSDPVEASPASTQAPAPLVSPSGNAGVAPNSVNVALPIAPSPLPTAATGANLEIPSASESETAPAGHFASGSPIKVDGVDASVQIGRTSLQPDYVSFDGAVTLRITNVSNREIGIGWFRGAENASLRLNSGQVLSAKAEDSGYQGIPNCAGTRPTTCAMRELAVLSPGETVEGTITLHKILEPSARRMATRATSASFTAQIAIAPGGALESYGKVASVSTIKLVNNID